MTARDYETIAAVLARSLARERHHLNAARRGGNAVAIAAETGSVHGSERMIHALADRLASQNDRFDRARFLRAAGSPEPHAQG